jgi:hypothetical protein
MMQNNRSRREGKAHTVLRCIDGVDYVLRENIGSTAPDTNLLLELRGRIGRFDGAVAARIRHGSLYSRGNLRIRNSRFGGSICEPHELSRGGVDAMWMIIVLGESRLC